MAADKLPKKSETIEIRLDHATKTAFMRHCRADARTASEALRALIDGQLAAPVMQRRRTTRWRALGAALAGLVIGAGAAPSLARVAHDPQAAFDRLDRNHDGLLSLVEYRAR